MLKLKLYCDWYHNKTVMSRGGSRIFSRGGADFQKNFENLDDLFFRSYQRGDPLGRQGVESLRTGERPRPPPPPPPPPPPLPNPPLVMRVFQKNVFCSVFIKKVKFSANQCVPRGPAQVRVPPRTFPC